MRHKNRVINLLERGILHGRKQNTAYRVCYSLLGRKIVNIRLFFCKTCHQAGIGNDNKIIKLVLAYKFTDNRQHRMPLVLVALVNAVGQRIAVKAHQQTEDNLRIAVAAFL